MPLRLLATDLDGTLISPDETIPPRTAAALAAARDAGIIVVFATGRSHFSTLPIIDGRQLADWLVCSNGATLFDAIAGTVEERLVLDDAEVATFHQSVVEAFPAATFGWETGDGFLWDETWHTLGYSRAAARNRTTRTGGVPTDLTKVLVGVPGVPSLDLLEPIRELVSPAVHVATSGAPFAEITAYGAHKGAALRRLSRRLGIGAQEAVAFGDNHNDTSMLSWAGHAVVMPHAHRDLLAMADEIAPANEAEGVAQVIERLLA